MQETVEGNLFYSTNNNYSINQVTKKTGENIALKTVNPVAFKPIYIVNYCSRNCCNNYNINNNSNCYEK